MNVFYKAAASRATFICPFPSGNLLAIEESIPLSAFCPKAIE
jgi:hypothetical protein